MLDSVGVSADAALDKMRLMALLVLGSRASGSAVPLADVQRALDITPEQVGSHSARSGLDCVYQAVLVTTSGSAGTQVSGINLGCISVGMPSARQQGKQLSSATGRCGESSGHSSRLGVQLVLNQGMQMRSLTPQLAMPYRDPVPC